MLFLAVISLLLNIIFTILAGEKIEPIHTFFYPIAWYTFIIFISAINFLLNKKEFVIFQLKNFIKLALISVFIWLIFELFNLRIKNWIYHGVLFSVPIMFFFGFISYSTVLPGIFNIADFFEKILKLEPKKVQVKLSTLNILFIIGCISIVLILILPKISFPLLWLCFILLIDPLNFYLFKKTIILNEMHKILPLVISGFICGFLWEFWNIFSGAHWVYTLPLKFLMKLKLFQMPIFGYFGFPVFAIETYQIYRFIENILSRMKFKLLIVALYIAYCVVSFYLLINYSVKF